MRPNWLLGIGALCAFLASCGEDNATPPPSGFSMSGSITYGGSDTGSLIVSVDTRANPVCPTDQPVQYKLVGATTFPYAYAFANLPEGAYHVFGFLDVGSNASFPPCPQADDLCGNNTTPVTLNEANPTGTLDIALDLPGCVRP